MKVRDCRIHEEKNLQLGCDVFRFKRWNAFSGNEKFKIAKSSLRILSRREHSTWEFHGCGPGIANTVCGRHTPRTICLYCERMTSFFQAINAMENGPTRVREIEFQVG